MRGLRLLGVLGAGALLGGCLYLTDLDGFSTPAPVVVEAGAGDPLVDAGSAGGGGAGGDGGPVVDGSAPGSPCAAPHVLCDDFDDGTFDDGTWTVAAAPEGRLAIEEGTSVSPPRALRVTLPERGDENVQIRHRLVRVWESTPWRAARLELDMLVAEPAWRPSDRAVAPIIFTLESDTTSAGVFLYLRSDALSVNAEGRGDALIGPIFPYGVWTHVSVDISPTLVRVVYGGTTLEKSYPALTAGPNPRIVLFVGLSSYEDPIPAMDVRFDNVVVDFD